MQAAVPAGVSPDARSMEAAQPAAFLSAQALVLGLAVAVLLALVGYPLLWLLFGAFGLPQGFGLEHLARAFTRPQNFAALLNTLELALGAGVLSILFGVPLAWATARSDMPWRGLVHALVALSYITPPYLTALAYIILLGPDAGQFNRLLRALFALQSGPLNIFSMPGVIFVIGIHVFAFTYFLTYSALKSVDAALEESAQMLGARPWQTTLRINLPLVAPAITGGALLAAIDFNGAVRSAGHHRCAGADRLSANAHLRHYRRLPPALGRSLGAVAAARGLDGGGPGPAARLLGAALLHHGGWPRGAHQHGRTRRLALAVARLLSVLVFFSAAAPLGILALTAVSHSWTEPLSLANLTLQHFYTALFQDQVSVRGILNSFKLATAAATLAVLIGAAVAYLDVRSNVRGRRLLDYSGNPAAGAAGDGYGRRYPDRLHSGAVADLWHPYNFAHRLRRPLPAAGNA